MLKKKYSLLILLLLVVLSGKAQQLKLRIKDETTKQSLPGATIFIKQSDQIFLSNEQGEVNIDCKQNKLWVQVSYVGYRTSKQNILLRDSLTVADIELTRELVVISDEVFVSAQRKSEKPLNIPYATALLDRQHFENFQPRTTPEMLTAVNGVFIQKTNHGGGSPFVRGLTGNQILMLVDGIRLNNSTFRYGPNQYLNTIDVYSINRIEVAKGTGSVQYGSDALGGVIHVFTREPQLVSGRPQWRGSVTGKYMSDGMEKTARGELNYESLKVAAITGFTYRNFGDLIGGDTTDRQSPSGYKEYAFDAKIKWKTGRNSELVLAHQYIQQKHVPVYHKIKLENFALNEFDPQQRILNYAKWNAHSEYNLMKKVELILSVQETLEGRESRKNNSSILRKEKDRVKTTGLTGDILSIINKNWSANSGIEFYLDKVNSTRSDIRNNTSSVSFRGLYPDHSKYGNYSIYSLHHLSFGKWVIDAGARFNSFRIRLADSALGKVELSPSALVGNTALMYSISKWYKLFAALSTGFRAPNVDDMGTLGIVDFRYEIPTNNLRPEKSLNTEIGLKFKTERLSGTASVYFMRLKNLITRVKVIGETINGYQVYRKENTESAFIKGAESELNWEIVRGWNLIGGISYSYGQNITRNEPLRRVPPFNGRIIQVYTKNRLFTSAELLFASEQSRLAQGDKEDNRIAAGGTPGWKVVNLSGGYQISSLNLNIGIQNILNEDYRIHGSGMNGVGRSIWFSVLFKK